MIRTWFCAVLLAAVVITPATASAQCGMGGGMGGDMPMSGHDHAKKEANGRTTKHDKEIKKLLSDQAARMRMFELIAEDDALLQEFLSFSFESPRGRTFGAELLRQARLDAATDDRAGLPPAASSPAVAVFQCPMHPEVTSSSAGTCPQCGMKLARVEDPFARKGTAKDGE